MTFGRSLLFASAAFILAGTAHADGWYIGGSIGLNNQSDSDNSGATGAFTTGNLGDGSTLDVAAGTSYGWTTEFDSGMAYSLEAGLRYDTGWRSGVEITRTDHHSLAIAPTRGAAQAWHAAPIHTVKISASHVATVMLLHA